MYGQSVTAQSQKKDFTQEVEAKKVEAREDLKDTILVFRQEEILVN
jgi:hypothetical protein